MNWEYTGDDPAVFPTLQNPDGTTVFVKPGEVIDLGEQEPNHRWLQPTDSASTTRDAEQDDASADAGGTPNTSDAFNDGAPPATPDAQAQNAPQA